MSAGSISAALNIAAPAPYKNGREWELGVTLTLTDSYVTNGVTVDLSGLNLPGITPPYRWAFNRANSADTYSYIPGTTRANGKVIAWAGGSQHASDGAWEDDTINATFWFRAI